MSIRIINVLDPSVVGNYLATSSGEHAILNVICRNRGSIYAWPGKPKIGTPNMLRPSTSSVISATNPRISSDPTTC